MRIDGLQHEHCQTPTMDHDGNDLGEGLGAWQELEFEFV